MSTTTQTVARRAELPPPARPRFTGAVGGELGKLWRQRATLAMLAGGGILYAVLAALILSSGAQRLAFERAPAAFVAQWLDVQLALFGTESGILLLLVSARLVGARHRLAPALGEVPDRAAQHGGLDPLGDGGRGTVARVRHRRRARVLPRRQLRHGRARPDRVPHAPGGVGGGDRLPAGGRT